MNNLKGKIVSFESEGDLSIVQIGVDENTLSAIVIEKPESSNYLNVNTEVNIYFKETEVILAKNQSNQISIENRILCEVAKINKGVLLTNIKLKKGGDVITSIISTSAFNAMEIKVGDEVIAMVKMNEIMIAP